VSEPKSEAGDNPAALTTSGFPRGKESPNGSTTGLPRQIRLRHIAVSAQTLTRRRISRIQILRGPIGSVWSRIGSVPTCNPFCLTR
jgi:hypothetical protein